MSNLQKGTRQPPDFKLASRHACDQGASQLRLFMTSDRVACLTSMEEVLMMFLTGTHLLVKMTSQLTCRRTFPVLCSVHAHQRTKLWKLPPKGTCHAQSVSKPLFIHKATGAWKRQCGVSTGCLAELSSTTGCAAIK